MYCINSEPPKNCLDCPLCQGEYGRGNEKSYCAIKPNVKLKYKGSRPKECPIIIDNAPSVDTYTIEDIQEVRENALILGAKLAQRPKGEWLKHDTWDYSCSICKETSTVDDGIVEDLPNFCPNCGAKMKGGVE